MRRKKLKLKNWVTYVICLLAITLLAILTTIHTENAINQCVKSGKSYNYCVEGLSK